MLGQSHGTLVGEEQHYLLLIRADLTVGFDMHPNFTTQNQNAGAENAFINVPRVVILF